MTDPLVGSVLDGRYRVESVLAHGGMSTVYTGTDLRLDRTVAVKVMSPALARDPAFVQRFVQEARTAARLSHVNVVSVHDQGEDGGCVFLVMELVRGRTLRDLLREHGRLSPELAVAICEPLLAALSAAHRAGLVHRDVKPENVLLSDEGVVKVADFGLARAVAEAEAVTTHSTVVMGTIAYVAPEQVSRGATDARTDVYSAGIVLYEMLTGVPPYGGGDPVSVAYQHVHADVPPPGRRVAGLPPQLDGLVIRATRRDPRARPHHAGALLAELFDVRKELGLRRVAVPPRLRVGDRARREPAGREPAGRQWPSRELSGRGWDDRTSASPGRSGPTSVWNRPPATHDAGRGPQPTTAFGPAGARGAPSTALGHPPVAAPGRPVQPPKGPGRMQPPKGPGRTQPTTALAARPARPAGAGAAAPLSQAHRAADRRLRRRRFLVAVIVVLVLTAALAGGGWWLGSGRFTTAPPMRQLYPAQAATVGQAAHLRPQVVRTAVYRDTVPAGAIAAVTPGAGSRVGRGSTLGVALSRLPRPVPDRGTEAGSWARRGSVIVPTVS
ncbi:MAG: protein kinase domain-containing protein [Mycobacteriales bacterium]